jgi:hypothetical protein
MLPTFSSPFFSSPFFLVLSFLTINSFFSKDYQPFPLVLRKLQCLMSSRHQPLSFLPIKQQSVSTTSHKPLCSTLDCHKSVQWTNIEWLNFNHGSS